MATLIVLIRRVEEPENPRGLYDFWLALTLTYIRSKALPLRLFAWDQVQCLIEAARKARPPARSGSQSPVSHAASALLRALRAEG
jgi:hypothetical protein